MGVTIFNCSNCNKPLKPAERDYCEKTMTTECAECQFHAANGTRTIEKYNAWLRGDKTGSKVTPVTLKR